LFMKQLQEETISLTPEFEGASLLMEVVPRVMRRIRTEMRSNRAPGLTVPQLRTLVYIYRNEGASLSEVAEHVGLKLPSMSKTVDALVARRLVIRKAVADDRRYVSLRLSAHGLAELSRTRSMTEARLAEVLGLLLPEQQARVVEALKMLGRAFEPHGMPASKGGGSVQ
jgi:DNA-binding MarR family transcriptional regulator